MAGSALERYEELGFDESLQRIYQYPIACRELSSILRGAYSKLPKSLQSLVFNHTLTAFRRLPQMQTQTAVSAANLLIQSAEAVLPKQKRVLAVTEFRHAKIAHKRRCKDGQEEGATQFPQDVLVHIFSSLDLRSLLSAASVCWLWNLAASDNYLWNLQYVIHFGDVNNCLQRKVLQRCEMRENDKSTKLQDEVNTGTKIYWRDTFIKAYEGESLKKLTCYRGYCEHCNTVVWLSKMKCSNQHVRLNSKNQQIKPISTDQIVGYILDGTSAVMSSSDSDSDSDEVGSISKLWAVPRPLRGCQ
ncbi:F-box protein At5g52880-like isoform X1 [Actinidia eriantha]|uniref:F-box protein At5g52880-like isoform X1 n=1 Tax=Actinidia eriantha TaxID=165200 RepID=UPI002590328D|nr:F-box protein At5g52880-like isoform X1 [Actinidia eriantha]